MAYGTGSHGAPPPEVSEMLAGQGELVRQDRRWEPAPVPAYIRDLLGEDGYNEPIINSLAGQLAIEMRGRLGQTADKQLTRSAIEKVGLLMYAAGELDDKNRQPTEELAELAQDFGVDFLADLHYELKEQFREIGRDIRRTTEPPIVREPRAYRPKNLTLRQRSGRKLLEG